MIPPQKVFDGKTGTGASSGVHFGNVLNSVIAQLNLTYGSTPTITVGLEGSQDHTNWIELATGTFTTGTPKELTTTKPYQHYRLNITANTNVTVTGYIGGS